jgi:hypothetical protein
MGLSFLFYLWLSDIQTWFIFFLYINHSSIHHSNIDGLVKSLKTSFDVIPAKAGIQCFQIVLDACLRRRDGISHFLRVCQYYFKFIFDSEITFFNRVINLIKIQHLQLREDPLPSTRPTVFLDGMDFS